MQYKVDRGDVETLFLEIDKFLSDCRYLLQKRVVPSKPSKLLSEQSIRRLNNYIQQWEPIGKKLHSEASFYPTSSLRGYVRGWYNSTFERSSSLQKVKEQQHGITSDYSDQNIGRKYSVKIRRTLYRRDFSDK